MKDENVLCVTLANLEKKFRLGEMCWKISADSLNQIPFCFMNRQIVENDNNYKQLIAYAVVVNNSNKVLCYKRSGSEKRLSGLWSAAIGGHVNEEDIGNDLFDTIKNGMVREFKEEIGLLLDKGRFELIGMINEEFTDVGHCHTGIVFCVRLKGEEEISLSEEISDPMWVDVNDINFGEFEMWSHLAVKSVFGNINKRKVFISFLGTNNYVESRYDFGNGEVSKPVRFIQEALMLSICKDWTENDKVFIFCTDESEKKNWKDNGQERASEPVEKVGLEGRLKDNFPLFNIVEMKKIPEGFSEDEIWGIFNCVYRELTEDDEIYFDVTHAFRSIPLFSTVLFNYSGFLKHTNLKSIMYGAFEKLGTAKDVKDKIPIESRIAPIVDLTNIIRLQQFTDVVSSFVSFGRLKKISDVLSIYSATNPNIKQIRQGIEDFDDYLMSNRMMDIRQGKWFISIKNAIKPLRKSNLPNPLKQVLEKLVIEFQEFVPEDSDANIIAAINWAVKYEMVFTAYIFGEEFIITKVSEKYGDLNPFLALEEYGDRKLYKKDKRKLYRDFVSSICAMPEDDVNKRNYKGLLKDFKELADEMLAEPFVRDLRINYVKLASNRNSLGHAKGDASDYKTMLEEFTMYFGGCMNTIKQFATTNHE